MSDKMVSFAVRVLEKGQSSCVIIGCSDIVGFVSDMSNVSGLEYGFRATAEKEYEVYIKK
jgi:hypothetical protein